jgi:hypothetical protein
LRLFLRTLGSKRFDPEYDTLPMSHFTERIHKVFAPRPYDPTVLRPGVREKLVS